MKISGIHIYNGLCPDINNGEYSRDPDCPCCQALIELEKFKMGYFVCPDCEYKISPEEFLTGGKVYE